MRERERTRRGARSVAVAFIAELRGKVVFEELMRRLEKELVLYGEKEAALQKEKKKAKEERAAAAAAAAAAVKGVSRRQPARQT